MGSAIYTTKLCGRCKNVLPIDNFYYRHDRKNYTSKCKECFSEYQREYKAKPENLEKIRPKRAAWQKKASAEERRVLGSSYIKKLLVGRSSMSATVIPETMVDAKRVQMQIKRFLEDKK